MGVEGREWLRRPGVEGLEAGSSSRLNLRGKGTFSVADLRALILFN